MINPGFSEELQSTIAQLNISTTLAQALATGLAQRFGVPLGDLFIFNPALSSVKGPGGDPNQSQSGVSHASDQLMCTYRVQIGNHYVYVNLKFWGFVSDDEPLYWCGTLTIPNPKRTKGTPLQTLTFSLALLLGALETAQTAGTSFGDVLAQYGIVGNARTPEVEAQVNAECVEMLAGL